MGEHKKFEDLEVWKKGCRLAVNIYEITSNDYFKNDWGLRDQLRKAAVSVPSNIAEGFERNSDLEFKRFLRIAKGSCGELRSQLYIAKVINAVSSDNANELIGECVQISSMIQGLIKYLSK